MSLSTLHILFLHRMKNCYLEKAFMLFVRLSDAGSSSPSALFLLVKSVTGQQRRKKHRISWRKVSDCLKLHREAKSKRLTHAHTDPVSSSLSQRGHFVTSKYFRFFHCFQHPRYPRALHNFHYSVFVFLCPSSRLLQPAFLLITRLRHFPHFLINVSFLLNSHSENSNKTRNCANYVE